MRNRHADPDLLASRDHQRESDGSITANGITLGMLGRCACRARLYTRQEASEGSCVDCQLERRRNARAA